MNENTGLRVACLEKLILKNNNLVSMLALWTGEAVEIIKIKYNT